MKILKILNFPEMSMVRKKKKTVKSYGPIAKA